MRAMSGVFYEVMELVSWLRKEKKSNNEKESVRASRDTIHRAWNCGCMNGVPRQKPVTYAFVDAANIVYRDTLPDPWKIDLKELIGYLQEHFGASKVLYFGGVDSQNTTQIRLYQKMRTWGYELHLNPIKRFVNEQGKSYVKADVDSHMTFEMMRLFPQYHRAVVLTGDGDFYWVLQYLLGQKDCVWLLSSHRKTAKELKQLFGHRCISLDDTRQWIEYMRPQ